MRLSQAVAGFVALLVVQPAPAQVAPAPVLELSGPSTVEVGRKCVITAATTAKKVTWKTPSGVETVALDGRRLAVWALPGTYTFVAMVPNGDDVEMKEHVLTVIGPRPPPEPKPPEPQPPDPQPVKSFRVIWVTESATTPTVGQNSVIGAKTVRDYLAGKATPEGGVQGWRHYDPNTNAANDQPTIRALWDAAKTKITTVPCVIVEVNGKAEILPFPANAAEALKTLKQYGG